MLKISADKLNDLFDAISAKQTLYIPVDREAGSAEYKKYESSSNMKSTDNMEHIFFKTVSSSFI